MKRLLTALTFLFAIATALAQPIPNQTFREAYYLFSKYAGVDSAIFLPQRDTNFTPFRPAIVFQQSDQKVYVHNGTVWDQVGTDVEPQILDFVNGVLSISDGNSVDLNAWGDNRFYPLSSNPAGYITSADIPAAQTLSLGSAAGNIAISGGNAVALTSIARTQVTDFDAYSPVAGVHPTYNTTGSTGFPTATGMGIRSQRVTGSDLGAFHIQKAYNGDGKLMLNVGLDATTWKGWETFATEEWSNGRFLPLTGGTVTGPTTFTDRLFVIPTNNTVLTANSIHIARSSTPSATNGTFIRGADFEGNQAFIIRNYAQSGTQAVFALGNIENNFAPTQPTHLTNKEYVDGLIGAQDLQAVTTTGNVTTDPITIGSATEAGQALTGNNAGFGMQWNDAGDVLDWGELDQTSLPGIDLYKVVTDTTEAISFGGDLDSSLGSFLATSQHAYMGTVGLLTSGTLGINQAHIFLQDGGESSPTNGSIAAAKSDNRYARYLFSVPVSGVPSMEFGVQGSSGGARFDIDFNGIEIANSITNDGARYQADYSAGFTDRSLVDKGYVDSPKPQDIEVTGSANGVILESPDGTRWRITVDNTGTLQTTAL